MRLFRQAEKGDWNSVFERFASSVEARVSKQERQSTGKPRREMALAIPGTAGELIDKITILQIRESHIKEPAKLDNIRFDLALLRQLKADCGYGGERLARLEAELKAANFLLWNVENSLREHEARGDFGAASSRWRARFTRSTISGSKEKHSL